MDYNVEFKITLPDELLKTFGIDEDTAFEAYFEDGAIKARILDEDEDIYTGCKSSLRYQRRHNHQH